MIIMSYDVFAYCVPCDCTDEIPGKQNQTPDESSNYYKAAAVDVKIDIKILLDLPAIKKNKKHTIADVYGHEQAHVRFLLQIIQANEKKVDEMASKNNGQCKYKTLEDCEDSVMTQVGRRLRKKMLEIYAQGGWHEGDNGPGEWPKEIPKPKTDPRPPSQTPVPPSAPPVDNGPYYPPFWDDGQTFTPPSVPDPEWPEGVRRPR